MEHLLKCFEALQQVLIHLHMFSLFYFFYYYYF